MPLYDDTELDIPIGPGCEFETIEEAMMIRERPEVKSEVGDFGSYDIKDEELDILLGMSEIKAFADEPFTVEDIERHLKWITEQHEENFGPDKERTPEEEAEISKQMVELFGAKESSKLTQDKE